MERGLILLAEAFPGTSTAALAEIPVGQRDGFLFCMREMIFGPNIAGLAKCPSCGELNELAFGVADILQESMCDSRSPQSLNVLGYKVHFRLPCSRDLLAAVACGNLDEAYQSLIQRTVLSACYQEQRISSQELPADVIEAMAESMLKLYPQADVRMEISCSSCGNKYQQTFDIIWFFWSEIDSWAWHTLREVDYLARAYGWSEAEILSLSSYRRQCYLEMSNHERAGK